MSKILILNGALPHANSKGTLNTSYAERARDMLEQRGHEVRLTNINAGYDVEAEIESHIWADKVILQFPVYWMGLPWHFKKYFDEVYTAGCDGRLCRGDGRTTEKPKENYGLGGSLTGTRYLLSVTFNAPSEGFDNPQDPFFEGASVDNLLIPVHQTLRFLGMEHAATFSAHDVVKNPETESDFARFDAILLSDFIEAGDSAAA